MNGFPEIDGYRIERRLGEGGMAAARLEHPNIVGMYEVGRTRDGARLCACTGRGASRCQGGQRAVRQRAARTRSRRAFRSLPSACARRSECEERKILGSSYRDGANAPLLGLHDTQEGDKAALDGGFRVVREM